MPKPFFLPMKGKQLTTYMPGGPFCLFGFSRIQERHAPSALCVCLYALLTQVPVPNAVPVSGGTCAGSASCWDISTGTEASCPCHSRAVSWLGCHLQGAGAGQLLSAHSWRAPGLCPSLHLGGWAAANSCCLQPQTALAAGLQHSPHY